MAQSPAHKFGQIIGDTLESAIEPLLINVAKKHNLYLDRKGIRIARGKSKKVSWKDKYGNIHDLDYVLERGGTAKVRGNPVAFVEIAWRRYTKHSRNKAQEIQGAIMPLKETHYRSCPFIGVVLAGEFTEGSLEQLRSLKFAVLYFPFGTVIEAFNTVGIDANSDEETPDADFARRVKAWESLSKIKKERVRKALRDLNATEVVRFTQELELAITRLLVSVRVLPLHGAVFEWNMISDAVLFIENYDEDVNSHHVIRYEIELLYSNGDKINGSFLNRLDAIQFLRDYECAVLTPA